MLWIFVWPDIVGVLYERLKMHEWRFVETYFFLSSMAPMIYFRNNERETINEMASRKNCWVVGVWIGACRGTR